MFFTTEFSQLGECPNCGSNQEFFMMVQNCTNCSFTINQSINQKQIKMRKITKLENVKSEKVSKKELTKVNGGMGIIFHPLFLATTTTSIIGTEAMSGC